jgi:N-acetylmuramic acid 6-phosphate etherase
MSFLDPDSPERTSCEDRIMTDRSKLTTEKRNPRSADIDRRSTLGIVDVIQGEDRRVAAAVRRERRKMAAAVDVIAERLARGGRLFYVGAGTSGRLGVLDASECPPTFGTRPTMVQGIIAGGRRALVRAVEGAEDRAADGVAAIDRRRVRQRDVVCGIAASGVTPFVLAAMKRARELGAATLFVTCAPEAASRIPADIVIAAVVGPEVVTGSTRMKAGTATKLVLNTLTTATMIRLGKVYGNLMVDLRATNEKLKDRSERIVAELTGLARSRARKLLKAAGGEVKTAIVMHARRVGAEEARALLKAARGQLRGAMEGGR